MDYTKELLLFVASSVVGVGVTMINKEMYWEGIAALLIGAVIFIGRGFYKKYFK